MIPQRILHFGIHIGKQNKEVFGLNEKRLAEKSRKYYEGKEIMVGIDDYDNTACPIIISTPIVIDACFKSKGPNYNPYN